MHIAYITTKKPTDKNIWSGSTNFIYDVLTKTGHQIDVIGSLEDYFKLSLNIFQKLIKLFGLNYDPDRSILLSKYYAWKIKRKLKKKYDLIFVHETNLASYLNIEIPMILWTDISYSLYKKTYLKNLNYIRDNGLYLEKLAFKNLSKLIYTSDWVVKDLRKKKYLKNKKIFKLPLGSNFPKEKILFKNSRVKFDQLNLLSIGVDWDRKGFAKAILVNQELNKLGIKSCLNIVGLNNRLHKGETKNVNFHKFLNKNHPQESSKLKKLFLKSHYFILLSKAEAHGLVLIEASAFGLPKLINNIGGMTSLVRNKKDGLIFEVNTNPKTIAKQIKNNFKSTRKYINYSKNSYKFFNKSLNKKSIIKALIKIIKS